MIWTRFYPEISFGALRRHQEEKYIYYRCSRYKGNCEEPYVRQEKLFDQFVDVVARVSMTPRMHQ